MIAGRSRGFSLMEMLVSTAIVAVLAAILFPVYTGVRNTARRSQCSANLSQIAKAFQAYVADHHGAYPNTGDPFLWMGRRWRWPMKNYVGFYAAYDPTDPSGANQITMRTDTILSCPLDPTRVERWDRTSYGYSASFYHSPEQVNSMTTAQLYTHPTPPCATVLCSQVRFPARKAMVADWLAHDDKAANWWSWNGSRNYLFADGHVMHLEARRIRPAVSRDPSVVRGSYPDINLTTDGAAGRDVD